MWKIFIYQIGGKWLCLYVDDKLIVGSDDKMVRSTKKILKSKFDIKDISLTDVISKIKKIQRLLVDLFIFNPIIWTKFIRKFNKDDYDMARTLLDTSEDLYKNKEGISPKVIRSDVFDKFYKVRLHLHNK